MHKYPTNLTDKQWQVIKNMLDPKERFRKYSLRSVFDGILYHRVNDVLTPLCIVRAVWIKVSNQFEDISHINNVAVQEFKAEIHILQPFIAWRFIAAAWRG